MPIDPHRVTADHIRGLSVDPAKVREPHDVLVDTTEGIRLVTQAAVGGVFREGSTIRRLLMSRTDLVESADYAGMTLAAYVKANAGRIAADLNSSLAGDDA
ncbi:hypothetical protein Ade02nite_20850 [Paractinoplanes deccanensis]|uniref:Uncharacterized protein n=1 Tax=Paractinoplanes deccanensis TaxID=113561 RepID=A0ABQ3Y0B6_9ACTN|nr:hypothetical protein [Actinoplanes deccanensis]GID73444.1 hypothetical protein Ade02nite_20850 [Actinoplanes deccanensis]